MKDWAALPLRLSLGVIFIAHGLQKAFGMLGGGGISGFSKFLSGLGFTPGILWAYLVAYVELLGGICLILGLFTRIASFLIMVVMTVAIITVHFSKGLLARGGGFEYQLVIICACITLMILGSGKLGITKKL